MSDDHEITQAIEARPRRPENNSLNTLVMVFVLSLVMLMLEIVFPLILLFLPDRAAVWTSPAALI